MDLAATAVGDPPTKASPGMGVGNVKNKQKKKKAFCEIFTLPTNNSNSFHLRI